MSSMGPRAVQGLQRGRSLVATAPAFPHIKFHADGIAHDADP